MWYEGVSVFFHAGLVGLNLSKIPINSEKTIWYVASPDNLALLEVIGKGHLSSTSSSHNHLQAPLFNTSFKILHQIVGSVHFRFILSCFFLF